jgi:hypothetical protein
VIKTNNFAPPAALYGPNWTTAQFARDLLDTNPKTLSRWKGGEPVPDWAALEIGVMLRERRAWIDQLVADIG